jgi:hypothetical protein
MERLVLARSSDFHGIRSGAAFGGDAGGMRA